MILGTITLLQKRGIFYTALQQGTTDSFADHNTKALEPKEMLQMATVPEQHRITPVEEIGNTDYINALFQDDGQASYPYQVTVWLLIEESIMDI